RQSKGHGRSGHKWTHFPNALAFSFLLEANPESLPLTSLEVSVLLALYLEESHAAQILLKWPNDLLNAQGLKCGGIICQGQGTGVLAVGIGLYLWNIGRLGKPGAEFKSGLGSVLPQYTLSEDEYSSMPRDIYAYLLSHRLSALRIRELWRAKCAHLEKEVL